MCTVNIVTWKEKFENDKGVIRSSILSPAPWMIPSCV